MSVEAPAVPNSATSGPLAMIAAREPRLRDTVVGLIDRDLGWATVTADDPLAALAALHTQCACTLLLTDQLTDDRDLLAAVLKEFPMVPVVVLMPPGREAETLRWLQRGAAGFVSESCLDDELAVTMERVMISAQARRDQQRLRQCVRSVEMELVLENDPTLIPALVAQVQDLLAPLALTDHNGRVRLGVALEESMLNAMYHGNLEVSSDLRQEDERLYRRTIEQRRHLSPYQERRLTVKAFLSNDRAEFSVADQGPGFDPSKLPDPTDPANLDRVGGRGLLLIRTFMDEVHFNAAGNRITLVKWRERAARAAAAG